MLPEKTLVILCVVAFLIFLWDVTLQLKVKEIERKIKDLTEKAERKGIK